MRRDRAIVLLLGSPAFQAEKVSLRFLAPTATSPANYSAPARHRHRRLSSFVVMSHWERSTFGRDAVVSLVEAGNLPALTDAAEWLVSGDEAFPAPPPGYVVSFGSFHERGIASPASLFLLGLLHHYGIEL